MSDTRIFTRGKFGKVHEVKQHNLNDEITRYNNAYLCPFCTYLNEDKDYFAIHIEQQHLGQVRYLLEYFKSCHICDNKDKKCQNCDEFSEFRRVL
ncbi:hypothetical protein [Candidatus Lokiarchaeum ossiferum]|uniref:hypothetical protein n=1 Tax=Candidatus Lokiarchaeum ossiferum TaxID=2951803 RepID=UPI00352C2A2E